MNEPTIDYAQRTGHHASHSRAGLVAFGCSVAAACGIAVASYFIRRPISGPAGGFIRQFVAPMFGVAVMVLWLGGGLLGAVALHRRNGIVIFAHLALAMSVVNALILGLMILLQY
jgi:hypothetical protein